MGKRGIVKNYASLFPAGVAGVMTPYVGWVETLLGLVIAFVRRPGVVLFIAMWKLATEALFLSAGAPAWEVVERGGSYAAPLALALVMVLQRRAGMPPSRVSVA
jgi:hypothetical protein